MTNQHSITPPPELVAQWFLGAKAMPVDQWVIDVATQAARWGADQELKACCLWLDKQTLCGHHELISSLRAARRPKPPSLKEQAQAELDRLIALIPTEGAMAMAEPIRRALEALPDELETHG